MWKTKDLKKCDDVRWGGDDELCSPHNTPDRIVLDEFIHILSELHYTFDQPTFELWLYVNQMVLNLEGLYDKTLLFELFSRTKRHPDKHIHEKSLEWMKWKSKRIFENLIKTIMEDAKQQIMKIQKNK